MLFRSRFDKKIEHIKDKNSGSKRAYDVEDVRNVMEKGDLPAMIISALLVILPVALIFLLLISFIGVRFITH